LVGGVKTERAERAEVSSGGFMKSKRLDPLRAYDVMFSHISELTEIRRIVDEVSETDLPVLIQGEAGTGKDLVARIIHLKSPRREKPFVKVNCAVTPQRLVKRELFGFERGAFVWTVLGKPGRFELAQGGTIFLDRIGGVDLPTQSRILRILRSAEVCRLGGTEKLHVDVRLISSTVVGLEKKVLEGGFREDLLDQLSAVHIFLPPLRERKDQLPALIDYFLSRYGAGGSALHKRTIRDFERYDWPGNLHELGDSIRNVLISKQWKHERSIS
jgi:transcriptional regulator with PAS, ATPase and Fis domain